MASVVDLIAADKEMFLLTDTTGQEDWHAGVCEACLIVPIATGETYCLGCVEDIVEFLLRAEERRGK